MIEPLFKSKPLYKDWIFYLLLILAIAALIVSLRGLDANAQVINAKGSAGAALAVTTQATVLDAKVRKAWTLNWTDAGDLMCEPIMLGSTTPLVTPTTTVGFRLTKANVPWNSNNVTANPSTGLSCVSTSGTVNVYSYEDF